MGNKNSGRRPQKDIKIFVNFAVEDKIKEIYDGYCVKHEVPRTRILEALIKYIPNAIKDIQEKTIIKQEK